jgi:hypothetical protein
VQDESGSKCLSHKAPRASQREETMLALCGFTAGGSGTASSEAITITAPRTAAMHNFDFIPAWAPKVNDN